MFYYNRSCPERKYYQGMAGVFQSVIHFVIQGTGGKAKTTWLLCNSVISNRGLPDSVFSRVKSLLMAH